VSQCGCVHKFTLILWFQSTLVWVCQSAKRMNLRTLCLSFSPFLSLSFSLNSIQFNGFIGMGNICLHCQTKWNR
jgi:hypothetical protein